MNKSIALLIIGVISLAMFLIMINQFATNSSTPPLVGVQNPLPQTSLPSSTALSPPNSGSSSSSTSSYSSAIAQNSPSTPAQIPSGQSGSSALGKSAALPSPTAPSNSMSATPAASQPYSPTAPSSTEALPAASQNPERSVSTSPALAAKTTPPPSLKETTTPSPAPVAKAPAKNTGPKTITKISVAAAGEGATVRIAGNTTLEYKTMHLKSPDRVVVDLEGAWAIKAPGVPNNKAVKNVRIGKQGDKTRIVIDLSRTPGAVNFIKVNAETMEVRVK